jgi:hypothetical protein
VWNEVESLGTASSDGLVPAPEDMWVWGIGGAVDAELIRGHPAQVPLLTL